MKNARIFLIAIISLALLFSSTSCEEKSATIPQQTGSFRAVVDDECSRTIQPASGDITVAKYKLFGSMDSYSSVSYSSPDFFTEHSVTVDNLKIGAWTFYVMGYNSSGTPIRFTEGL